MTIEGIGTRDSVTVEAPAGARAARLIVEADEDLAAISLDSNHLEALEAAVRAARLELDARAVSP